MLVFFDKTYLVLRPQFSPEILLNSFFFTNVFSTLNSSVEPYPGAGGRGEVSDEVLHGGLEAAEEAGWG